jgi:hypothetical protein
MAHECDNDKLDLDLETDEDCYFGSFAEPSNWTWVPVRIQLVGMHKFYVTDEVVDQLLDGSRYIANSLKTLESGS